MTWSLSATDLIQARLSMSDDQLAVRDTTGAYTYAELRTSLEGIVSTLRSWGIGAGDVVGVHYRRGYEAYCTAVALSLLDATCMPLQTDLPRERLERMVEFAQPVVVLTDRAVNAFGDYRIAEFDAHVPRSAPIGSASGKHPSYLLFTSGSTGEPKGVLQTWRCLDNVINWQLTQDCRPSPTTAQWAAFGFDVFYQEVFSTLAGGGALVCVTEDLKRRPEDAWELLIEEQVERLFVPFTALQSLAVAADLVHVELSPLAEIITAGEALTVTPAIRELFRRLGGASLVNHYGPTETHVVTCHSLTGDPGSWPDRPPIGVPIPNTTLYLEPGPEGSELVVAGAGVALGYLGDVAPGSGFTQLAERQMPLYRTGDLVTVDAAGFLEFQGRFDSQVKLRGYRIELGEIEAAALRVSAVEHAVAALSGEVGNEVVVLQYVAPRDVSVELARTLAERLPAWMVPQHVVRRAAIEVSANGKAVREAGGQLGASTEADPHAAPRPVDIVRAVFERVVGGRGWPPPNEPGMGVDSRLLPRLAAALRAETGSRLRTADLAGCASPDELYRILNRPSSPAPASSPSGAALVVQHLISDSPACLNVALTMSSDVCPAEDFAAAAAIVIRHHRALYAPPVVSSRGVRYAVPGRDLGAALTVRRHHASRPLAQMVREVLDVDLGVPFDLSEELLPRIHVFNAGDCAGLAVVLHHSVTDEFGMGVFARHVARVLRGETLTGPAPLPMPREDDDRSNWRFWKDHLLPLPAGLLTQGAAMVEPRWSRLVLGERLGKRARRALVHRGEECSVLGLAISVTGLAVSRLLGVTDVPMYTLVSHRDPVRDGENSGYCLQPAPVQLSTRGSTGPLDLVRRGRNALACTFAHLPLDHPRLLRELQLPRAAAGLDPVTPVAVVQHERGSGILGKQSQLAPHLGWCTDNVVGNGGPGFPIQVHVSDREGAMWLDIDTGLVPEPTTSRIGQELSESMVEVLGALEPK